MHGARAGTAVSETTVSETPAPQAGGSSKLASLRQAISRMESAGLADGLQRQPLGHPQADMVLQGGIATGALHEIFAQEGRNNPAATGFTAGLAARVSRSRPLLWVTQDFLLREQGRLSMQGLVEFGLDPSRLITVRAADIGSALRVAGDALACAVLGAVVLDVWGEARQLDLVASRKLTLAAQASGVTGLVLRIAAEPAPSTAETRWIVRAAHSPPAAGWSAWGAPRFDVELIRNRHGPIGRWIMEWKCDECLFDQPAAHPQPVAAAPAHRPHQAKAIPHQRRAG